MLIGGGGKQQLKPGYFRAWGLSDVTATPLSWSCLVDGQKQYVYPVMLNLFRFESQLFMCTNHN